MAFVVDADDARDKMNDDGDETPGMLRVLLFLGGYSLTSSYRSRKFRRTTEVAAAIRSIHETRRIIRTS